MAASQYATPTHMIAMFDERMLGELTIDDNTSANVDANNTILMAAINRGSSEVEMQAVRGNRYTRDQLATLYQAEDWGLIGLVCDLAIFYLISRRGAKLPENLRDRKLDAENMLTRLGNGEAVFGQGSEQINAGKPDLAVIPSSVRGSLKLASDMAFFPRRRTQEY